MVDIAIEQIADLLNTAKMNSTIFNPIVNILAGRIVIFLELEIESLKKQSNEDSEMRQNITDRSNLCGFKVHFFQAQNKTNNVTDGTAPAMISNDNKEYFDFSNICTEDNVNNRVRTETIDVFGLENISHMEMFIARILYAGNKLLGVLPAIILVLIIAGIASAIIASAGSTTGAIAIGVGCCLVATATVLAFD